MKGCRPFTDQEVNKLIKAFKESDNRYKHRDVALFLYGINTGFRISELLSMRIKDVSHKWKVHEYATVRRAFTKGKNEGSTKKVEALAIKYMQIWLDELKEQKRYRYTDYVFQNQLSGNKAISRQRYNDILVEICTSNGIFGNLGTHSMRKTFTNKLRRYLIDLQKDTDIPFDVNELLQKEGRWRSKEAMERYLSFLGIDLKENVFNYKDSDDD